LSRWSTRRPGRQQNISTVFSGNPDLKAEKSVSANLGFVFEPTRNFSTSLDYYWIKWKDIVTSQSTQSIVDAACPNPPADPNVDPPCPSTPQVPRDPNTNSIITVYNQFQNSSSLITSGLDLEMRYTLPTTSAGRFVARLNAVYLIKFEQDGVDYQGSNSYFTYLPRIRGTAALDWDYGAFALTTRFNYQRGVRQDLPAQPTTFFAPQAPEFQTGTLPHSTKDYYTFDLYGSYQITKNFKIAGSVVNAFDKKPPYDPGIDPTNLYDFTSFDVRGRLIRLALTYKM
jgi:iron complex outermembrane receptor protein